jgi:hypothetical protein
MRKFLNGRQHIDKFFREQSFLSEAKLLAGMCRLSDDVIWLAAQGRIGKEKNWLLFAKKLAAERRLR